MNAFDDNRLFNGINNANRIAHIRVNHNMIRFSNMIRIMSMNGSFKCDLIILRMSIGIFKAATHSKSQVNGGTAVLTLRSAL